MFCPKCGAQNADTMNFCAQCGTALKPPVEEPVQTAPIQTALDAETPVEQTTEPVTQTSLDSDPQEPVTPPKKKKGLKIFLICLCALLVLAGTAAALIFTHVICLFHEFKDATCTAPKTCAYCDVTEGEALGHDWSEATCTAPKFCYVCDEVEGEALGHNWIDATCTTAKTCSVCQATEGEVTGHTWTEATCTEPKTCSVCNETEGKALGHTMSDWEVVTEATLIAGGKVQRNCTVCKNVPETDTTDKKTPKADGVNFNFTDDEFVAWIHENSTVTVTHYETDAETSMYEVIMQDGTSGLMFLDHEGTSSTGKVHMITTCFTDPNAAAALAIWFGTKFDRSFSSDAASDAILSGEYYISSEIALILMDGTDTLMFSLVTNDYIDSL